MSADDPMDALAWNMAALRDAIRTLSTADPPEAVSVAIAIDGELHAIGISLDEIEGNHVLDLTVDG